MSKEKKPLVSIIIVNFNGKPYLQKCLESIMNNNYKNFEIILVDNNSKDDSIEMVKEKFPLVNIIKLERNLGYAEPNNIGAKSAKGELLFFLNNDTTICPDSIDELVKVIENQDISICQSLLLKQDGSIDSSGDFFSLMGIAYSSKESVQEVKPILSARGASMMVKKNVFWQLNGLDKNFFASFEDVDFGWRSWISGYKAVVVPKSIVYHIGGKTDQQLNSQIRFHGAKNTLILCLTNFEFLYSIQSLFLLGSKILFRKLSGKKKEKSEYLLHLPSFNLICRAIKWVFGNYGYISEKRKRINSQRMRSTRELVKMGLIT